MSYLLKLENNILNPPKSWHEICHKSTWCETQKENRNQILLLTEKTVTVIYRTIQLRGIKFYVYVVTRQKPYTRDSYLYKSVLKGSKTSVNSSNKTVLYSSVSYTQLLIEFNEMTVYCGNCWNLMNFWLYISQKFRSCIKNLLEDKK